MLKCKCVKFVITGGLVPDVLVGHADGEVRIAAKVLAGIRKVQGEGHLSGNTGRQGEGLVDGHVLSGHPVAGIGIERVGLDHFAAFVAEDEFGVAGILDGGEALVPGCSRFGTYNGNKTAILERMANPNLGWEEAYMTSLGIDATIKKNWNVTVDLYHTINSKILLESPMSPSTGFFAVMDNVGKVRNMGVEFAVDGNIINNKNFGWNVGFNIGLNQNRVLELPNHSDIVMNRGDVNQIIKEGEDIYSWYMPKWLGVDPSNGLPMWEKFVPDTDEAGNPIYYIDEDGNTQVKMKSSVTNMYNEADQQIVGKASPAFSGGISTSLRYGNFTLSANGNWRA